MKELGGWLGLLVELAAYGLGVAFALFLLFMVWMILEDILLDRPDGDE